MGVYVEKYQEPHGKHPAPPTHVRPRACRRAVYYDVPEGALKSLHVAMLDPALFGPVAHSAPNLLHASPRCTDPPAAQCHAVSQHVKRAATCMPASCIALHL